MISETLENALTEVLKAGLKLKKMTDSRTKIKSLILKHQMGAGTYDDGLHPIAWNTMFKIGQCPVCDGTMEKSALGDMVCKNCAFTIEGEMFDSAKKYNDETMRWREASRNFRELADTEDASQKEIGDLKSKLIKEITHEDEQ